MLFGAWAGIAALSSWWDAPHRRSRREPGPLRVSTLAARARAAGLLTAVATGIGFALEPGRGRTAVAVRSAIFGTVVAVVVLVSAHVRKQPGRLGLPPEAVRLELELQPDSQRGLRRHTLAAAKTAFARDPSISAWVGGYHSVLPLDGREVPILGWYPDAALSPSMLSGHGLRSGNPVVLGTEALHDLGKKLGDTVVVTSGSTKRTLTIVGTATMPTVGVGHGLHLSMGTGAVVGYDLIPALNRNIQQLASRGPNVIFARFRSGADPAVALRALQKVVTELNVASRSPGTGLLSGPEHPGQIVDYRTMGETPAFLAAGLAVAAVSTLELTLAASYDGGGETWPC